MRSCDQGVRENVHTVEDFLYQIVLYPKFSRYLNFQRAESCENAIMLEVRETSMMILQKIHVCKTSVSEQFNCKALVCNWS